MVFAHQRSEWQALSVGNFCSEKCHEYMVSLDQLSDPKKWHVKCKILLFNWNSHSYPGSGDLIKYS